MGHVIIVGGGIIGLLSARELLSAGCHVTLIDQSALGTEASWAGGGIVSPLYPWRYDEVITALASWAQCCYPNLVQQLSEETGIDPEFNPCGMYMLDADEKEVALDWARRAHHAMESVAMTHLYQREPQLNQRFKTALWMPAVGNVRNPRLLAALKASLRQFQNFTVVEHEKVTRICVERGRATGVQTINQRIQADQVLMATGAWSNLLAEQFHLRIPVGPVKGQMLIFEASPGLIHSILLNQGKYLIPRLDGRILVGSTLEFCGYDKTTTEQARDELLCAAIEMVPQLSELRVEKHWAGLRPGSPAGVPFIGSVQDIDGLFVNCGHFRNGLVLAPASAKLIADLMLGRDPIVDPLPYDPNRTVQSSEMI